MKLAGYGCYRWWPPHGEMPAAYKPSILPGNVIGESLFAAVLAHPRVADAIGIDRWAGLIVIGLHLAMSALGVAVLGPRVEHRPRAYRVFLGVVLAYNVVACLAFVVLPGKPNTLWWSAPILYASITGAIPELEPSLGYLAVYTLAPIATIPWFLSRGADPSVAIAAPLLAGMLSGFSYDMAARWAAYAREQRATLQARVAELERAQLARDLHDGVGSTLSIFGLYADLVERYRESPDELWRIAGELRSVTREGLGELRGMLDALGPELVDVGALAAAMRRIAWRMSDAVDFELSVDGDARAEIDPRQRLALVRVFQEALANAIRHGRARRIEVRLVARDGLELAIRDDGCGFDPTTAARGRGLDGMRERASQLAGQLAIESAPGRGTLVRVVLAR